MSFFGEKIFHASLDVLDEIRDYVFAAASKTMLDKKKIYKLQLAVDEMTTNIISYAFQGNDDQDGNIYIDVEFRGKSLVVYLRDQGIPFDPRGKLLKEKKTLTQSAEERCIGGLGIYLAMSNVDKFSYKYADGFNVNRLEVYYETN